MGREGQTVLAWLMKFQTEPTGSMGKGLKKGTMVSASTSVWVEAAPPVLTLMPDTSVPSRMSLVPFELLSLHWSSEGVGPKCLCAAGPLREMPRTQEAHCFPHPKSLMVFTARSYDFSSQHWNPGLGALFLGWDPLFLGWGGGGFHN